MLRIKVLGPGCQNCRRVEQRTMSALETLSEEDPSVEATVQHVTEYVKIAEYPIVGTPGLVINEQVVCSGRVPRQEEIFGWLKEACGASEG